MHYRKYKTILSPQNGINIYRGCQHGCIYCDSRSLCYQMQHRFEDIEVKIDASKILKAELRAKRKRCMIGTGSMTDPYIPLEAELKQARSCFEEICEQGFGLSVLTKSNLILRDIDLLDEINRQSKCVVQMTMTTFDQNLCKLVEPGVCATADRYDALKQFQKRKVSTVVWLSPILPWINDTEKNIQGILSYCADAGVYGVLAFGFGLTLREGNREYFYRALDRSFPGIKAYYQKRFGTRYEITSPNQNRMRSIFHAMCEKYHIVTNPRQIFEYLREYPSAASNAQLSFF